MVISRTPYRVSLFGGGTDIETYFSKSIYGGICIGFAFNYYSYISLRETPHLLNHPYILHYAKTEEIDDIKSIQHNGIRGVLEYLNYSKRLEIINQSDLPSKTGIGSSSTFIVGLLNGISRLNDITLSPKDLAIKSIFIERKLLNEQGGIQDQILSSYGGLKYIDISQDGLFKVRPLRVSEEFINQFEDSSVMFFLGQRDSFSISAEYQKSESDIYKDNIREIAYDGLDAFEREDIYSIAKNIRRGWIEKKKISNQISNAKIDSDIEELYNNGALCVRLLGNGGSGFLFCLSDDIDGLIQKTKYKYIRPKIEYEGSKIIYEKK